jgi:hypothetical protein
MLPPIVHQKLSFIKLKLIFPDDLKNTTMPALFHNALEMMQIILDRRALPDSRAGSI